MYILGINAYHADSSAAIVVDGKLVAAVEEERFTRVKHWAGFPAQAVQFCLKEAGITLDQVDHIAVGRNPMAKFNKKIFYMLRNPWTLATVVNRLGNSKKIATLSTELSQLSGQPANTFNDKIHNIEHHRSHMASAFYLSGYDEAALLSIDGSGDFTTTMLGVGQGNNITVLDSVDFPVSLGLFYSAFTQYLGFYNYGDEYKVMGLASYGNPKYLTQLEDVIELTKNGLFTWNSKYFKSPAKATIHYVDHVPKMDLIFTKYMEEKFGKARKPGEELTQVHKDIAASVQCYTERTLFHIAGQLQQRTGLKNLCLAGGVAQNSVANGKLLHNTCFDKLYVPCAGHDAGISIGSAYYVYNQVLNQPRVEPSHSAYTGCRYESSEIEDCLRSRNISFSKHSDEELYDKVTNALMNSGVVGWFQGRSEFGPRALGARSILADPRRTDAKELLNEKIKRRESFRPFAPSILKEYVSEYFEMTDDVPFMEKVFPIRESKHKIIPAVTHVDGTGRLQSVDKTISPRYYDLINAFYKKTGVPILLNTSFNENEPIVNSPVEALNCFLRTKMDMLVLENIIVER